MAATLSHLEFSYVNIRKVKCSFYAEYAKQQKKVNLNYIQDLTRVENKIHGHSETNTPCLMHTCAVVSPLCITQIWGFGLVSHKWDDSLYILLPGLSPFTHTNTAEIGHAEANDPESNLCGWVCCSFKILICQTTFQTTRSGCL